jgi:hypothetical protein
MPRPGQPTVGVAILHVTVIALPPSPGTWTPLIMPVTVTRSVTMMLPPAGHDSFNVSKASHDVVSPASPFAESSLAHPDTVVIGPPGYGTWLAGWLAFVLGCWGCQVVSAGYVPKPGRRGAG